MSVAGFDCGDGSSIAGWVDLGHGGLGEVAAVGDLPFVVDVSQDRADEADDGGLVREDADDAGSAFDLLVDPLQGVGAPDLADGRSPHAAAPVTPNPTTRRDAHPSVALNELEYDWPQAYARFEVAAMNTSRDWFTEDELSRLAQTLGHPVLQVMAHI